MNSVLGRTREINKVFVIYGSSNSFDHLLIKPSAPIALFLMDEIWSANFRHGSKRTPSLSVYVAYWVLTRQKVITLHLEPFKSSKLSEHHVWKLFKSDCKSAWKEVSLYRHHLTSSAFIRTREWVVFEGRSYINEVKSSSPRLLPCWTPKITRGIQEREFLKSPLVFLLDSVCHAHSSAHNPL